MPHGLKLNQLRYVLSAAEQGSFRRAAAALNLQQSTISRRIRELEDQLGAALFERGASGVRPTPAGSRFLQRAREAAAHLAEAADVVAVAGRAEQGRLRVGVAAPLGEGPLFGVLADALSRGIVNEVDLTEGRPQTHLAALAARRLDVAFLPEVAGQALGALSHHPLWREPALVALRGDHPLASARIVEWSDLTRERVMVASDGLGDVFLARLLALGDDAPPRAGAPTVSLDTLLHLAALGQGLVIGPQSMAGRIGGALVGRAVRGPPIEFSMVWSPRNEKRALRRFVALAMEAAAPAPTTAA